MRRFIALALCLFAGTTVAQGVFRSLDADGNVVYSDQPSDGANQIELKPVQGYEPAPPTAASSLTMVEATEKSDTRSYEYFAVASPAPEDTIRDNQGNVDVAVDLRPPLQRGDTLRLLLDGELVKEMSGTVARLDGVDRGAHTVSAEIVADSGKIIASAEPVTFFLHRISALAN